MIDYYFENLYGTKKKYKKGRPDIYGYALMLMVAEETKNKYLKYNLNVELITAKTPIKERLVILEKHEKGEIESLISMEFYQKVGITLIAT